MKSYYNIIIDIRDLNLNGMKWFRVHTQREPYIKKIPININMPVLVDVYKHFKIIHAQVKMLLVCANTFNAKKNLYLNLRPHNPQYLWAYKPNIGKMDQGWVFHHVNGSLHSFSLIFLVLKWVSYSFTIDSAISTSLSTTSYYKLANWKLWDVELHGPFSFALFQVQDFICTKKEQKKTSLSYLSITWKALCLPTYWMTNSNPL